jgi:hypothetical protein
MQMNGYRIRTMIRQEVEIAIDKAAADGQIRDVVAFDNRSIRSSI